MLLDPGERRRCPRALLAAAHPSQAEAVERDMTGLIEVDAVHLQQRMLERILADLKPTGERSVESHDQEQAGRQRRGEQAGERRMNLPALELEDEQERHGQA